MRRTRKVVNDKMYCTLGEHWVPMWKFPIKGKYFHSWCDICKSNYDRIKQADRRRRLKADADKIEAG